MEYYNKLKTESENDKQLQHQQKNLKMDESNPLTFDEPNHSEFIHSLQVLWGKYDPSKFREELVSDLIVVSHEENTEICGIPRARSSSLETQMI